MNKLGSFLKQGIAKIIARKTKRAIDKWSLKPVETQHRVFKSLLKSAQNTKFGQDHNFSAINSHKDFVKNIPIRGYEEFSSYIELIKKGEKNILWKGLPVYFAITSGTTSGIKYIPITKESLPEHFNASKNAMLLYIDETGETDFLSGKLIFLQGSPTLDTNGVIKTGRLSGISAHHVPKYLQSNRLPSWETNCIEDWETKVDKIIEETINEDMRIIGGIPSWVQMYFEKIQKQEEKKIGEVFKNFNLFIYGGVNYEPYKKKFIDLIGRKVDSIEFYPASEGFFAFQNNQSKKDLLLLLNSGIFYEFISVENFNLNILKRITVKDVKLNTNYVLIISTNAGLWAYNTGDTVMFTELKPHKILVTGRVKHFISAFGEHVIVKDVENAINKTCLKQNILITEFTVAPEVNPTNELPYHEWFIEFSSDKVDVKTFSSTLDHAMQEENKYYLDLVQGKILQPLKIRVINKRGFNNYMSSQNKLGGQFKIPKLSNDRKIADELLSYIKI
ncbi:GH3 auxin-responsive promoter family protein [Flavobacteriaceae bacterium]|nr:GH3 auxin-responsive promoter family protein [Flavobacteriaceae bacterium]MDC0654613.1 GH3 auxin-responsive promoter family protein [Flavobacteriaceae bacterium]